METGRASMEFAQAPPRRSLTPAIAFVAVALLALLVPFIPYVERIVLTIVNVAVVVLYLSLRRHDGPADHLEVILPYSILHVLCFGISAVYLSYDPEANKILSLNPYITSALALGVVGYMMFLIGYGFFFTKTAPSGVAGLAPRGFLTPFLLGLVGLVGYVAGAEQAYRLTQEAGLSAVLSAVTHLAPLFLFSWFLVWAMYWRDTKSLRNRLLVIAFLPIAACVIALTFGSKELGITVLAFPALSYSYARRTFPTKSFVALVLVLVFLIFPLYNTFRTQQRGLDSVVRLERSFTEASRWDSEAYMDRSVRAFFGRLAVITSVAAVLRDTGRWVEFAKGRTLILGPIGLFIPRFVWPDKPVLSIGHEFGETFRLISETDRDTHIAPTMVGELYWNFQVPGVIVGMLILGAAYRWLYERYGRSEAFDPVRRSIYMAILPVALHLEGSIAIAAGGVIKTVLMLTVLVFVLREMRVFVPASEG